MLTPEWFDVLRAGGDVTAIVAHCPDRPRHRVGRLPSNRIGRSSTARHTILPGDDRAAGLDVGRGIVAGIIQLVDVLHAISNYETVRFRYTTHLDRSRYSTKSEPLFSLTISNSAVQGVLIFRCKANLTVFNDYGRSTFPKDTMVRIGLFMVFPAALSQFSNKEILNTFWIFR